MTLLAEPVTTEPDHPASAPPDDRPRWVRPALAALLLTTAVTYFWGLSSAGWANEFYAAATQAGTQSWKAFLFGSLDPGNAITVDKPPAALWVMVLSCRIFGFSTLAMLAPQALMGVGSVALLYTTVRRTNGYGAGLLAGAALAATPVAALMFRFNNPDALLVLLLLVAAYCTVRALDGSPSKWIMLAGAAIGFAFLAKLLQALLVVPALALVVLIAVPGSFWVRIRALLAGLAAMVVSAGWLIVLVDVWPAESRPYIGGSTDNTLLQLTLGYNGLGRVFGGDGNPTSGPDGGGPGGPGFGGEPGILRMFDMSMGTEVSWLLPAALIGLIAGLWFTRRSPRTGRTRAALLLWGGWTIITAVVFSLMKGIMHPYYTVALAPGVAALVGISVAELWRGKAFGASRWLLAAMMVVTGIWNFILLDRTADWLPWLRWVVLIGAIVVASILAVGAQRLGRFTMVVAASGIVFGLLGSAAYTVATVHNSQGGGVPMSGPSVADGPGGGDGRRGPGDAGANEALHSMLLDTDNRWAAATVGSHVAGSLELHTGVSVMAIGGFNGADASPTLEQFQRYVADGQVRYFIASDGRLPGMEKGTGAQILEWVQANYPAIDVDGTTVYDLAG